MTKYGNNYKKMIYGIISWQELENKKMGLVIILTVIWITIVKNNNIIGYTIEDLEQRVF